MRKYGIVLAVVAALVAAVATSAASVKPRAINLLMVDKSIVDIGDVDPNSPPTVGKQYVLENDLYRWNGSKRGAHVGTLQGFCAFTKTTGNGYWQVCTGAALLPAGQIAVAGSIRLGPLFDIPVVGGTGAYTGARGYVRIKSIGNGSTGKSAATIVLTG